MEDENGLFVRLRECDKVAIDFGLGGGFPEGIPDFSTMHNFLVVMQPLKRMFMGLYKKMMGVLKKSYKPKHYIGVHIIKKTG